MKNTFLQIVLCNGISVKMTINFKRLYLLKEKNEDLYRLFFVSLNNAYIDVLELLNIAYVAYLIANIDDFEKCYSHKDFLKLFPVENLKKIYQLIEPKSNNSFRKAFSRKMSGKGGKQTIPKFELEDVEDFYSYFVLISKISENLFWNADYAFLLSVLENKTTFDEYMNKVREGQIKK